MKLLRTDLRDWRHEALKKLYDKPSCILGLAVTVRLSFDTFLTIRNVTEVFPRLTEK